MGTLLVVLAGLLLAAVLGAALVFSRLRALSGHIGSFEASLRLRTDDVAGGPWSSGFGVYRADRLVWWRARSLWPAPKHEWLRDDLVVTGRVPLDQAGQPDLYLVQCRYREMVFDLTMSSGAYAGLASWIEAAPPNIRHYVV
ncbi:Protein of unknown function (DUF2550) [Sanguibacter keddieii DSM 10542]|uniref:DUF2550 domain-containing protein n=1 Tax=Sanguibacter keddieii (strain ATCC 51767 / DSM 10542 / NCFB 3025 / ST-74) TaxID=446469 RepID=D1BCV6_SANKS|nr:DUF2550 domain-containing protein [Sanguibacter keddieii]ACZ20954.1 Protein of unknown function (DUF2550) [Sanguibacter keddieii DSM 10542]